MYLMDLDSSYFSEACWYKSRQKDDEFIDLRRANLIAYDSCYICCVSIQSLHPSEDCWRPITQSQRRMNAVPINAASFLSFWTFFGRLFAPEKIERKKERRRWHLVAYIVTFVGLGSRNFDVKHLVTQPGNAPKAKPSHLTTADEVNKVSLKDSPSKTAKAESFEGR